MMEVLKDPICQLMGTLIIGALSVIIVVINKRIANFFVNKVWSNCFVGYKNCKLKKEEIQKNSKIRELLVELRLIVNSDRACLFQFHNGSVFTTKRPIWKVSNTHETISPGTSSEIKNLQDIKASSIIEFLQLFWTHDYPSGVMKVSPLYCGDCPNADKEHDKKVIFIEVDKLEDGYYKSLLIEEGIKCAINVPIYNNDNNCMGFVAVNYCENNDMEKIKKFSSEVCKYTSKIQFILLN